MLKMYVKPCVYVCVLAALLLSPFSAWADGTAEQRQSRLDELAQLQKGAASPSAHLRMAEIHRDLFQLDKALEHYGLALGQDASPAAERSFVNYLLAIDYFDQAESVLGKALKAFPNDPMFAEQRAAVAAARGQHDDAIHWLERSWDAGRDPLAWLTRGQIEDRLHQEPYRSLLDADLMLTALGAADAPTQDRLLILIGGSLTDELAPRLVDFLSRAERPSAVRRGFAALDRLADKSAYVAELLGSESVRVRRAALLEIWQGRDSGQASAVAGLLRSESDPGNQDLAVTLLAILDAGTVELAQADRILGAVPTNNQFHHLALYAWADLHEKAGDAARADGLRQKAAVAQPLMAALRDAKAEAGLAAYWECQERSDLIEMRELLYHHRYVEPIDARQYGLPQHDFDDQKNLTIPERLFLRSWTRGKGEKIEAAGTTQYHREIRHFLRRVQAENKSAIDCSGKLVALADMPLIKALGEGTTEVKVEEDNNVDSEVHISVNPYDERFLVATSNDYDGAGGNDSYRSSDWGKTWTSGDVATSQNCCDPVSYYTQTDVGGTPTDVIYHSTLAGPSPSTFESRVFYSTNNGTSWTQCGSIGTGRDRQDHAIDTNPASSCYNTLYLAHHNGTQFVAASTGTTFPYCQTWNEQSTGIGGTIGSAIVVSTNGVAHNIFTQHGTPGGVYHTSTSNCGSNWSSSTKLANVMNPGDFEWPIPSTCSRQVYRYPQADSDRQDSSDFKNNIYVVWNDLSGNCTPPGCNGNTTCNNDIYLMIGTPNDRNNPTSWTWTQSNLTDGFSDNFTDEFYPSLTVDQADGSIYLSYYRTNSGASSITPRKTQVHYVMTKSIDGGATWETPYQITDQPTNESGSGADLANQWGDYTWNDVINGVAYGVWTDRREGADEDIWVAKVCSEPTHWTERSPTFAAPATTATDNGGGNFTISWSGPDVYWGDGGEDNTERKYQLIVDGGVAQDNISWTATSVGYTPSSGNHTVLVRAINQCGLSKDYASTTVTGGGGGNNPPVVSISSPADPTTVNQGVSVTFTASATDVEDGDLSGSLAWTSNLDGSIGSGASFSTTSLSLGTHIVTAAVTDSGSAAGSDSVTVTVNSAGGSNGPQNAVYNSGLGAPACVIAGSSCDSLALLDGRGTKGPEPNQPNTLTTCSDGGSGTYHSDESNDKIVVSTLDNAEMVEGATVRIDATVWAWSDGSNDSLDLYYAADANSPSWTFIATLSPSAGGAQTLSTTYTLPSGTLQAVRANFRYQGSASSCSGGSYDDADDLVFAVGSTGPGNTAPTVSITAPANGGSVTQGASVSFTGTATDTEDGNIAGSLSWSSSIDGSIGSGASFSSSSLSVGSHTITASVTDSGSLSGSDSITLTVNSAGAVAETATFNGTLGAPSCGTVGISCTSAGLLDGRGTKGPEPNQPNTLDSCTDGGSGTYHSDESSDAIKVSTTDGSAFAPGKTVTIEATVWAWNTGSADNLDLYYAANANSPSWVFIGTLSPSSGGSQTLSTTYTLPSGTLQAVRANFRYQGSASSCSGGNYDDADDLVFAVNP